MSGQAHLMCYTQTASERGGRMVRGKEKGGGGGAGEADRARET